MSRLSDAQGHELQLRGNYSLPISAASKIETIIPIFEVTAVSTSNQPANDDVQIISDSASDTQVITLWGIDNSDIIQTKQLTLNGTTAVDSVLVPKWKTIYGAFLGDAEGNISTRAVGTITIREKSGGLAIATIAPAKLSTGMQRFSLADKNVIVENIAGNTWFNPLDYLATTTGANIQMAGRMNNEVNVDTYLTLISDSSGSTVQCIINA